MSKKRFKKVLRNTVSILLSITLIAPNAFISLEKAYGQPVSGNETQSAAAVSNDNSGETLVEESDNKALSLCDDYYDTTIKTNSELDELVIPYSQTEYSSTVDNLNYKDIVLKDKKVFIPSATQLHSSLKEDDAIFEAMDKETFWTSS